jgi:hypothetical protein
MEVVSGSAPTTRAAVPDEARDGMRRAELCIGPPVAGVVVGRWLWVATTWQS